MNDRMLAPVDSIQHFPFPSNFSWRILRLWNSREYILLLSRLFSLEDVRQLRSHERSLLSPGTQTQDRHFNFPTTGEVRMGWDGKITSFPHHYYHAGFNPTEKLKLLLYLFSWLLSQTEDKSVNWHVHNALFTESCQVVITGDNSIKTIGVWFH